ncbi:hypothetical protein OZX69_09740 (plasmid) [Lactobacillus sp. ESL0731]|uniref:hypothetical protein n=1 Tax=unclassified Lactobacillus TaxID=2620435 RepID=UPI0023F87C37|nr:MULTISPECIES: hypothetical protein [unclassified Lactobacillus]WEV52075.1 hypothetical protein OZX63_09585 [Lactobacillus sp. ESL0700]WEV63234.1 hypothetical protein OZX69_09740 [Lactobacillus sp. ESL0731]
MSKKINLMTMTDELSDLHKQVGILDLLIIFSMGLFAGTFYVICRNSKTIYTEAKTAKFGGWIWLILLILVILYAALFFYMTLMKKVCNKLYSYNCLLNKKEKKQYIQQVLDIKSRVATVFWSATAIYTVFYVIAFFLMFGKLKSIKIGDWTALFTLTALVTAVHYVIDTDKKICEVCYKYLDDPLNKTGIF